MSTVLPLTLLEPKIIYWDINCCVSSLNNIFDLLGVAEIFFFCCLKILLLVLVKWDHPISVEYWAPADYARYFLYKLPHIRYPRSNCQCTVNIRLESDIFATGRRLVYFAFFAHYFFYSTAFFCSQSLLAWWYKRVSFVCFTSLTYRKLVSLWQRSIWSSIIPGTRKLWTFTSADEFLKSSLQSATITELP